MKNSLVRFGLLAVAASLTALSPGCRTLSTSPTDTPAGQPMISGSGGIISIRAISSVGNAGDFELDLFLADSNGHIVSNLSPESLSMLAGLDTAFIQKGIATATTALSGPFSAELLIDQSNSMAWNDAENLRLKAAALFMDGVTLLGNSNDEVQLSTFYDFAYGGLRTYGPFTSNGSSFDATLQNLAGDLGPGTPLYDAIYAESDSLALYGKNGNKALIVLTDGDDNESTHSLWTSIDHAKSLGIKVFAIALKTGLREDSTSKEYSETALFQMAMQTGGGAMFTKDPKQAVSYYQSLGQLVHGGASYYKTNWHVSLPKESSMSGRTINAKLRIATTGGSDILAPFTLTFP